MKKAKPAVPTESDEQIALFRWAAYETSAYPELGMMYHIPNERKCSAQQGARMKADVLEKIGNIEVIRDKVAERAPLVVSEYRDKLHQRIAQLTDGESDEARLITEVAIFAARAAIDEELVRLKSHTAAIRETVELAEPVGRKLDFLVQELNREVNTIGSKASDTMIAQAVVSAKGEIEKLREQVQNVE